ncbi:UDP-N-acetyl-2-amino-2-deoxyglucuronate dehydrogenase [Tenacibaculum sp. MAR_2009_124]|uniref:Gfo/Idh/MocA family protein n=1 Tax=Tenacibaculum sp. MAR_2009_124 TaxID=1250059 RepID=UPI00089C3026|nr:Gfo/Idh/MocA family oxidoreductase [Tenacibaculum sp. MAR_2009_124]SEB69195.1 UDP-N-acetyl-2-amino-2-deoxyglucuronate dehydrogenase [Tenacibaculum sp. MAR_2009_124]
MKNFALIGAAGYVAPRHMKAIKETGNNLVVALDKFDSVGVLDSYFPDAHFFTEYERFDRYIEKLKRKEGEKIDYFSICTPNYLHDSHVRMALRVGANAICEKPLVLNPWNIDALEAIEKESKGKIYTILQLRLHPAIIKLKRKIESENRKTKYDIDLTYITSRGNWYHNSWKGDQSKSGGIATNIGIHFFDMLLWVFGELQESFVHLKEDDKMAGYLEFQKARVRWYLSIDSNSLPKKAVYDEVKTYRSMIVDGVEIGFSEGFTDLHTKSYSSILSNLGFKISQARPSIELVSKVRNAEKVNLGQKHFLL